MASHWEIFKMIFSFGFATTSSPATLQARVTNVMKNCHKVDFLTHKKIVN
jgi:hypothetical protein